MTVWFSRQPSYSIETTLKLVFSVVTAATMVNAQTASITPTPTTSVLSSGVNSTSPTETVASMTPTLTTSVMSSRVNSTSPTETAASMTPTLTTSVMSSRVNSTSPTETAAYMTPALTTSVMSSSVNSTSTTESHNITSFQVMIEFVDITWNDKFLNKTSDQYKSLDSNVTEAVKDALRVENVNSTVHVIEFKPGSVLGFFNITAMKPEIEVKAALRRQMKNGTIGDFNVSKTLFSGSLFDVVIKLKKECNDTHALNVEHEVESVEREMENALPGNETATLQKVICPKSGNVTIATFRLQVEDAPSNSPDKELQGLKVSVERGQLGNFSLIPEWQAYIPGEKQFSVSFNLTDPSENRSVTIKDLEEAIKDIFKNNGDYRYVTVYLLSDNKTAVVKVGMKTIAIDEPQAVLNPLNPLKKKVETGEIGNTTVVVDSFKASVNPSTITQKVFKVEFRLNMSDCNLENNRKNASKAVNDYIRNRLKKYEFFLKADFLRNELNCTNGLRYKEQLFVHGAFLVYVHPSASELRSQFGRYLFDCGKNADGATYDFGIRVTPLTPTSTQTQLRKVIRVVCPNKHRTKPTSEPTATITVTEGPTFLPSPSTEVPVLNPSLYVKVRLGITWGEFCSKLEHSLKQKIAWNLFDKNGTKTSPDRIIFINVEKNCADPSKKDEQAEVWFYVSKVDSNKLHKCLTLKAYKVLKMFVDNGNTKTLGQDFEGKVIHVDLAGEDASKHKSKYDSGDLSLLAIILIAVACAVGLLLLTIACCCLFCCGGKRRRKQKEEDSHPMHVLIDANGVDIHGDMGRNDDDDDEKKKRKANKEKKKKDKGKKKEKEKEKDGTDGGNEGAHSKGKEGEGKEAGGKENVVSYENPAYLTINNNGDGNECNLNNSAAGPAPVIVTSPAPDVDETLGDNSGISQPKTSQASDTASSASEGSRRGSANIGGEEQGRGSKRSSPATLRHSDAQFKDPGRRRSSAYSTLDDEDIPLTHKTGTVGIVALAIRNRNEKKKEAEFKNLSKDVPEEEVNYPASTQSKNRSPDVLPAPKTRVKLSSNPDYINANWIRDHKGQRCYIATQHPLHETVEDFWRMVWEQESRLVVMVNEEDKEKPAEFMDYLPRGEGSAKSFGGIEVTVKQVTKKADYIVTTLNIADSKKPSSSREVSHMKFTSWKERALPNVALFVGFVTATREARKKYESSKAPTIVHCSDGLGFTSVYIAVDIGVKSHEESKTSVVDVFELSKNLRQDRHGIVCTLEHYNFIYQALYEYTVNYDESAETQKL